MYTMLLGGMDKAAFDIFHDMIDLNLRKQVFRTAARGRISAALLAQVEKLYADIRKLGGRRANIIHGIWAICDTKKDSLLLVKPIDFNTKVNEMFKAPSPVAAAAMDLMPDYYLEYRERDFDDVIKAIETMNSRARDLSSQVLREAVVVLKTAQP
jgi:hypothetical protein